MTENAYEPRDYPPFAVTVDVVLMTVVDGELRLLLIQRGIEPFKDSWAFARRFRPPGGRPRPCGRRGSCSRKPASIMTKPIWSS